MAVNLNKCGKIADGVLILELMWPVSNSRSNVINKEKKAYVIAGNFVIIFSAFSTIEGYIALPGHS